MTESNFISFAEQEAEVRAALVRQPQHPGLLAALGGVRLQVGDIAQGVALLEQAAQLAPTDSRILSDFGGALIAAGRLNEAEPLLRMAISLSNGPADNMRFNLAHCLHLQRRFSEALIVLDEIRQPGDDVSKLRGDLHKELGDWQAAAQAYMLALQMNPDNPVYLNDLGVMLELHVSPHEYRQLWSELAARPSAGGIAHYFLGNALRGEGEFELARQAYQRAVELEPDMAEAFNNLALVLNRLGQEEEAKAAFRRAQEINPALVAPQINLGALMARSSTVDEAETLLAKAVDLDPQSTDARVNYGAVLMRQRRFAEAEQAFRYVLAREPGHASAELNLGLLLLSEGDLAAGWPYYESRWKMPQLAEKRPPLATPAWTGQPLDGKTLFIYSEQGFGDNLQFARYLIELKRRFPSVRLVYYTLHALTDLFRSSALGDDVDLLPWGQPIPEHDFNCPVMSLPWRCGTAVASIPAPVPYLCPEAGRAAFWQARLPRTGRPRVGLVWATSETFIYRSAKTVALRQLRPLIKGAAVAWVNLQMGKEAAEIAENGWSAAFFDPMGEVKDFSDTAAIIANLDLVISVDTAVAHLAGAMGKPVWMIDRFDTDWRWLPPREDSPWYPTMRIFRQDQMGAWDGVIDRVCAAMSDFLNGWTEE
ncbi:MAG TPA: tetratricopeptide repeat protein [Azonexus sp.]|nr:tetratricopeptide repeat protein [Azonexus sp.]